MHRPKVALAPAPVPPSRQLAWSVAIDQARNALTERIATIGGGQAGAMAAALVTGKRTPNSCADMRCKPSRSRVTGTMIHRYSR